MCGFYIFYKPVAVYVVPHLIPDFIRKRKKWPLAGHLFVGVVLRFALRGGNTFGAQQGAGCSAQGHESGGHGWLLVTGYCHQNCFDYFKCFSDPGD